VSTTKHVFVCSLSSVLLCLKGVFFKHQERKGDRWASRLSLSEEGFRELKDKSQSHKDVG